MKYPLYLACGVLCIGLGAGCGPSSVHSERVVGGLEVVPSPAATSSTVMLPVSTSTTSIPSKPVVAPPVVRVAPPQEVKIKPSTSYVTMTNDAFSPKVMVIRAGDSVTWVNKSHVNHTVTASEAVLLWDSGNLVPGKTYQRTFLYPGTYNYSCSIHLGMKATIVVR